MGYDENGKATTDVLSRPKVTVQEDDTTTVVSQQPPSAVSIDEPPVEVSVSVVEVPASRGGGKLQDVSVLSGGGAEDQKKARK